MLYLVFLGGGGVLGVFDGDEQRALVAGDVVHLGPPHLTGQVRSGQVRSTRVRSGQVREGQGGQVRHAHAF